MCTHQWVWVLPEPSDLFPDFEIQKKESGGRNISYPIPMGQTALF
jgi:hypothetical protein